MKERQVAKDIGGTRAGPLGYDSPDVIHPLIAPEVKYMKVLSLRKDHLEQAKGNARGKNWGLFLFERGGQRDVVVLDYKFFLEIWNAYQNTKEI